jgi:hypothetical protein
VEAADLNALEQNFRAAILPGQGLEVCAALGQNHEQVAGVEVVAGRDDPRGESIKPGSQAHVLRIEEDAVTVAGQRAANPRTNCASHPGGVQLVEGGVMANDLKGEECAHWAGFGGGKHLDESGNRRGALSDPLAEGVGDQAVLACEDCGDSRGAPSGDEALAGSEWGVRGQG